MTLGNLNLIRHLPKGDPQLLQSVFTEQSAITIDDLWPIMFGQLRQQWAGEHIATICGFIFHNTVEQQINSHTVFDTQENRDG